MSTSSQDSSVINTSRVKLYRWNYLQPSFELYDRSFQYKTLEEFFSDTYKPFETELEIILQERNSINVRIYFTGHFWENCEVCEGEWSEVEHYLPHNADTKQIYDIGAIEDLYNSYIAEYREIVRGNPAEWQFSSISLSVCVTDLEEDLTYK